MQVKKIIENFLQGEMDILEFHKLYEENPEINDYLQSIIDDIKQRNGEIDPFPFPHPARLGEIFYSTEGVHYLLAPETDPSLIYGCPPRYESVRQMLTYEFRMFTHNVRIASGAASFFNEILVIFYQIDKSIQPTNKYREAFRFALDVIPEYLSGGEAEAYIQEKIIPLFPSDMKKGERKKAIKAKIKEEFRREKGYPGWAQQSEWPFGADGKPTTYIGKGKSEGDLRRWIFRDESNGEIITVEQYY